MATFRNRPGKWQAITDLLKLHPKGLKPNEIAELLEKNSLLSENYLPR
jgi:hypothetical protein